MNEDIDINQIVNSAVNNTPATIVNLYKETYDVYIGRNRFGKVSKVPGTYGWLGNPYDAKIYGLDQAIRLYRIYLLNRLQDPVFLKEFVKLRGKKLGCFCKPKPCHGDVIVEILNMLDDVIKNIHTNLE